LIQRGLVHYKWQGAEASRMVALESPIVSKTEELLLNSVKTEELLLNSVKTEEV
jgi:hypothetical protein